MGLPFFPNNLAFGKTVVVTTGSTVSFNGSQIVDEDYCCSTYQSATVCYFLGVTNNSILFIIV